MTPTPSPQPPVTKIEIFGWCMYDVADSAFTTVIITAFYAPYFSKIVVADQSKGDLYWGWGATISEVVVALIAPILGAIADFSGSRKKFLGVCAAIIVFFTAALYFAGPGMIWWGLGLFILANIGFAGGGVFIDSFLPGLSNESNAGIISGRKWAMGYISGLVATFICLDLANNIVKDPTPDQLFKARLIPLVIAIYYAVMVIPTFLFLRDRSIKQSLPPGENYVTIGFRQLKATLGRIRRYQDLFRLLIAFLVYNDGLVTVIYFASLYASGTLNFTVKEFGYLLVIMNVVAAVGALAFGKLADRIGQKKTISISLFIWLAAVVLAYFSTTKTSFYFVATLVGTGMGSCQSVTRSLFALFSPKEKAAEFSGFLGIAGKAMAFAGPLVFGNISNATGSQRIAILSIAPFFIIGMILLSFVNEERGKAAARVPVEAKG